MRFELGRSRNIRKDSRVYRLVQDASRCTIKHPTPRVGVGILRSLTPRVQKNCVDPGERNVGRVFFPKHSRVFHQQCLNCRDCIGRRLEFVLFSGSDNAANSRSPTFAEIAIVEISLSGESGTDCVSQLKVECYGIRQLAD